MTSPVDSSGVSANGESSKRRKMIGRDRPSAPLRGGGSAPPIIYFATYPQRAILKSEQSAGVAGLLDRGGLSPRIRRSTKEGGR